MTVFGGTLNLAQPTVSKQYSFPTLSLSINLHNYPNIYLSILFLLLQFSMIVSIYLLFTVLRFIRTVFLHVLTIWSYEYEHQIE